MVWGVVVWVVISALQFEVGQFGFAALAPGFSVMDIAPFGGPPTASVLAVTVSGYDGSA